MKAASALTSADRFRAPHAGRADALVAARFAGAGRKQVAALFARGAVRVDGRVARKGDMIAAGADIEVTKAPARAQDLHPVPQPALALAVIYQDDALVVMNKPAGMPSHPLHAGERGTLANALVARFPECAAVGRDPREAGLAHRLDAGTTGVIVAARRTDVWDRLRHAFGAGEVRKLYLALVALQAPDGSADLGPDGRPARLADAGTCDAPLMHRGKRMVAAAPDAPGALPASTRWRVRERFDARPGGGPLALPLAMPLALPLAMPLAMVECEARTGRMHQIRVHLAHAGAPIVGDVLYGGPSMEAALGTPLPGHFLHAQSLSLRHPVDGRRLDLEADLPASHREALAALATRRG